MKLNFTLIFCFLFFGLFSQNIKEYYIYCDPADFEFIYQNYDQDIYIPITIKYNNFSVTNAEMRIRGDGSRVLPKKSLKIKLKENILLDGKSTFNFNAEYEDKSYIQQYVTARLMKESGQICFSAEHARLYLNDNFLGLYLSVENGDEKFLSANNLDPNGTLYKATVDGASLSIFDNVYYHWESKAFNNNFSDLIELIDTLNNTKDKDYYEFANSVFDYDKMVNILAMNMLMRNYSSYYHNYYMYHDLNNTQKWSMLPWDLDKMFLYYEPSYQYHHTSKFWAPDNPFLERAIICDPIYEDIKSRIDELHFSIINNNYISNIIDSLEILLEQSVIDDNADGITNIVSWKTVLQNARIAFDGRYINLIYQFNNYARSFNVIRTNEVYNVGEDILLKWQSTKDPNLLDLTYSVYYGTDMNLENPNTTLIENLTDTMFTISTELSEGKYFWKVVAKTSAYAIEGFNNYNYFHVSSGSQPIVINEIFYKSDGVTDPGDWVELYNNSKFSVDLSNWYFQDEKDNDIFTIPSGTTIAANGYLVLSNNVSTFKSTFLNISNVIGNFNFGLKSSGELIRLKNKYGEMIDYVIYGSENPWPILPNGRGYSLELIDPDYDNTLAKSWQSSYVLFGTPGKQNSKPDSSNLYLQHIPLSIICYPNPFSNITTIIYTNQVEGNININVYNSAGKKVLTLINEEFYEGGLHKIEWDGETLESGIYLVQIIYNGILTKSCKAVKL